MKCAVMVWLTATLPLVGVEVETKELTYEAGTISAHGLHAWPADGQKHPCVVVVHDWWGNNEFIRERAKELAGSGYSVLAIDLYGNGRTTENPREASFSSSRVSANQDQMKERFRAGMRLLMAQEESRADQVAAIGYGLGANVVLQMARNGQKDLDGVVSFHGSLEIKRPNPPAKVSAQVLVCHGGEDFFAPPARLKKFTETMEEAGADLEIVTYPGAFHAFTDPNATAVGQKWGHPVKYDQVAAEAAWKKMHEFLTKLFQSSGDDSPAE